LEKKIDARRPLRVGYDAQALLAPNGGTGKGVQLRNLLGPHVRRFTGFAPNGPNRTDLPLVQRGLSRYNLWHQFSLPLLLKEEKIDIFLAPYNIAPLFLPRDTQLVLVLHDLTLMQYFPNANFRRKMVDAFRKFLIPSAVSRATVVLTVSEYSRQQILSMFPGTETHVIPCTISERWFADTTPVPLEQRASYLLMVTSAAPHKNADRALHAYAQYVAKAGAAAAKLRIVGLSADESEFRPILKSLDISALVTLEPYVSDEELRGLYRNAQAVLIPSRMEGFGIPVLEGMSAGTPVIASNTTSLPEVGGDAAYYFDPNSLDEMAAAIETVLGDTDLQCEMIKKGSVQAQKFHPATVQRQVEEFWLRMANVRS
jgi:glycosyltransferase involved in cell wall biosynthesis